MRNTTILAGALFVMLGAAVAHADQTIYYPDQKSAAFSVVAPDDFKLDPATEPGGFFNLNGPTGAIASFRKIDVDNEDDFKDAINDTVEWLKQNYKNVNIQQPAAATFANAKGFKAGGTGNDKQDGTPVEFVMVWVDLKAGKGIGEMWVCYDKGDQKGMDAVIKIANSFQAR
jgi:hypothetical protein